MRRDTGNVHRAGGDVDKEQDVIGDETLERANLDAQEVSRRQALPVSLQESRPSGVLASLGCGLDTILFENIGNGATSNLMPQIGERASDPSVSP